MGGEWSSTLRVLQTTKYPTRENVIIEYVIMSALINKAAPKSSPRFELQCAALLIVDLAHYALLVQFVSRLFVARTN